MQPYAKEAGIIAALARDSDRMLLLFPNGSDIPVLYVFLATIYNDTIRVFRGTQPVTQILHTVLSIGVSENPAW